MKKMMRFLSVLFATLAFLSCQKGLDDYNSSPEANLEALWEIIAFSRGVSSMISKIPIRS